MLLRPAASACRIPVLFVLALCACSPSGEREYLSDADKQRPIADQFAIIAETAVSEAAVEGVQFALVEEGEILLTEAAGLADRESSVPMTARTPINVASISKPLTAWGLIALAERRNLDLDASVSGLLSNDQLVDDVLSGHDVSLRMLLSHTSGLSGSSVPVVPVTDPLPDIADILQGKSSVKRARIERSPGQEFSYSGAGYLVLQQVIEEQTRMRFAVYMKSTVHRPAQMLESTFSLSPALREDIATYYRGNGRRRDPYHLPGAAGGLYSTADDMARYIALYTDSGQALRKRIISEDGFTALLSPVARVDESDSGVDELYYALGHYTYETPEGTKIIFHAGGNPGLRSLFVVAPVRNIGFFAVTNNDRGSDV